MLTMLRKMDLVGQKYGRWTVLEQDERKNYGDAVWLCRCDCGTERKIIGSSLRRGLSKSCGCLRREVNSERMKGKANYQTHGMSNHPVYKVWTAMKQRCHNPSNASYFRYGGRGITVCQEWRESFEAFYACVGDPGPGMSIDRIDNDGNYEPGNVRWATRGEQMANRGEYHCRCCRAGRMFRTEPGASV